MPLCHRCGDGARAGGPAGAALPPFIDAMQLPVSFVTLRSARSNANIESKG
jgi:hypothetical protein